MEENTPASGLMTGLLRQVSRSFYLTLRVLPVSVRPQIGLAYLLARATDTIADTSLIPVDQRLAALAALRERILGRRLAPVEFGRLAECQGHAAERVLLTRCEDAIALLGQLTSADQSLIRTVLDTIASGQDLDLRRFGTATPDHPVALPSLRELDDYTYRVAGCVGEFWTRVCRAHLFPSDPIAEETLLDHGVRFGKGLQLVNILRDLPADRLAALDLRPVDLFEAGQWARLRPLYNELLDLAEAHLTAGWEYARMLPRRCWRVRLACAWPALIGIRTLARLRQGNVLDPQGRIKISRSEVRSILVRSLILYPWPTAWDRQFVRAKSYEN